MAAFMSSRIFSASARAKNVSISLTSDKDAVTLTVKDDGIGFNQSVNAVGRGLDITRERATAVNGDLIVKSSPGKGTRILVSVPRET